MLLVLTHSEDVTTDLVLAKLPDLPVFRFNIDLWRDYRWRVAADGFELRDPLERVCRDDTVKVVYLRKLMFHPAQIDIPAGGSPEAWRREELEQLWLGLRDIAHHTGRLALVHPSPSGRWSKVRQMRVAQSFFQVPQWCALRDSQPEIDLPVVAKTFGQLNLNQGSIIQVQEVEPHRLSPDYPWFLQTKVKEATHDITVAWVDGRIFAYATDRAAFTGDDVRFPTTMNDLEWRPVDLSPSENLAITGFMRETGYSFGRLDFLRAQDGLWFLELNPNGQFAWLDPEGSNGLLDAVAESIRLIWRKNSHPATV